jgi:arginyl-tRNA synthetase
MEILKEAINKAIKELELPVVEFGVDHPKGEKNGDYSTNVALIVAKQAGKNPRELAEKIKELLQSDAQVNRLIERMEVAGAGFINFYLKPEYLLEEAEKALKENFGKNKRLVGKRVMVEYTDPNPFKEFHIGHLMSNTIGEALARLFESTGAEVKRACYQGDVGLHVAKSIWGLQKQMAEQKLSLTDLQGRSLKERQKFMGQSYAYGAGKYETDKQAKLEMNALNKVIYDRVDSNVNELYDLGRKWSLEYFETIYARLGTKFNEYFFESEAGPVGLKVVEEGLVKKVLELGDDGAVVYRGEKDGLHTRVFRNKLGLPTYEAKDLGLAKTKYGRYPYDQSYIVTANEITEYFRVVLRVMEQLYPDLRSKTTHMPHGMMKLVTGKMSSRTGKVVTGEGLLNELKEVVISKMGERQIENKEQVADLVAVGALKYTVLKQAIGGDIVYDPEKMTNLEGDTGPYIQYTYARAQSVLRKAGITRFVTSPKLQSYEPCNEEELRIVRWLYRYPEVVEAAGRAYVPHLVATYLYELAARYNTMYNQHQIVGNELRIMLTQATAQVLKSGLNLLGIEAPEEM